MKKTIFTILPLLAIATMTSCFKKDLDPVSDKNSVIHLNNLKINNLVSTGSTLTVRGHVKFEFKVQNVDTPGAVPDIVSYVDSFDVTNATGFSQRYDFDTPEKTKTFNFSLYFTIIGGTAQGVTNESMEYKRNGTSYLNTSLSFSGSGGTMFTAPVQTVNF